MVILASMVPNKDQWEWLWVWTNMLTHQILTQKFQQLSQWERIGPTTPKLQLEMTRSTCTSLISLELELLKTPTISFFFKLFFGFFFFLLKLRSREIQLKTRRKKGAN
ncbi:hypothetical protein J1N35_023924 [Gossypium stocksii]|uniref:Uncharacterized protein n=1 Tax=Gossypium stocksii TaxID=47602 RepID=A0A9D3VJE9_9ROSI|nr:hypothetical protein J1N35_023924 [Gossypium stocksii]